MEKMQQVWKYTVAVDDQDHEVLIPDGGSILTIEVDYNLSLVDFWVQFYYVPDDDIPMRNRTFRVFGTGQPVSVDMEWVGTSQHRESGLVWHLFEAMPLQAGV